MKNELLVKFKNQNSILPKKKKMFSIIKLTLIIIIITSH